MKTPIQTKSVEGIVATKLVLQANPSVTERRTVEVNVVKALMEHLKEFGYTYMADNGEDKPKSQDDEATLDDLFACDESFLLVHHEARQAGSVFLVFGNDGWDVISDWTANAKLGKVLEEFLSWLDKEQVRLGVGII